MNNAIDTVPMNIGDHIIDARTHLHKSNLRIVASAATSIAEDHVVFSYSANNHRKNGHACHL